MNGNSETLIRLSVQRKKSGRPSLNPPPPHQQNSANKVEKKSQHYEVPRPRSSRKTSKTLSSKIWDWTMASIGVGVPPKRPMFRNWTVQDVVGVVTVHPIPCFFGLTLLLFMGVEYTLSMVPFDSPPFDIGFKLTQSLHDFLAVRPLLNSVLAGLNTVFVGMQTGYILWTFFVEGRPRSSIAALFMFTCRGIMGYSTQLPLPREFLGSGVDFPVGNVSFFLFYSGHVAASMIASLDMKRMKRQWMSCSFDVLNILQGLRLLASRGHYTIDLAVGIGAGYLFDDLAGKYVEKKIDSGECQSPGGKLCCNCKCSIE